MSEREFLSRAPLGDTLEYNFVFFYAMNNILSIQFMTSISLFEFEYN